LQTSVASTKILQISVVSAKFCDCNHKKLLSFFSFNFYEMETHVGRVEMKDILKGFDYQSFAKFAVQFQASQFRNICFHKKERGFAVDFNSSDCYEIFVGPGNVFFGPKTSIPKDIRE
jgi:hypothetical protein